jgi:predicted dehydrogenase
MLVGFIGGCGHHYLRQLVERHTATAAVCGDGHDDVAARALADRLPGAHYYETVEALFDVARPEVISVGAVYGYIGDFVAAALERDLPTVSDKPIAATRRQLDRIRVLCTPGRHLITEFDARARREFRAARKAVQEGLVGTVVLAVSQKSYRWGSRPAWYADRASYGSTLLWVASHGIDFIRFVTGRKFTTVTARQANTIRPEFRAPASPFGAEDHVVCMFDLEGGGAAVSHADYLRPDAAGTHGDDRLRVAGSQGVLEIRDGRCTLTTRDHAERDITETVPALDLAGELLAAASGDSADLFSTAESLQMAEILLGSLAAANTLTTIPF